MRLKVKKVGSLKNILKKCKKQLTAKRLEVGYFKEDMYDPIEEAFYAAVPKANSITKKNPLGKPRRYTPRPAVSVVEVARSNEFGRPENNQPPRPFMRATILKNQTWWVGYIRARLKAGKALDEILDHLGPEMQEQLRETIKLWTRPPNAPATIAIKGFDKPLTDSGDMADRFIRMRRV